MSPDNFVYPWIGQNNAFEVDVHTFPDGTSIQVASQF